MRVLWHGKFVETRTLGPDVNQELLVDQRREMSEKGWAGHIFKERVALQIA
mgnify:FL=1